MMMVAIVIVAVTMVIIDDEVPFWSETGMSMTMMMAPLQSVMSDLFS